MTRKEDEWIRGIKAGTYYRTKRRRGHEEERHLNSGVEKKVRNTGKVVRTPKGSQGLDPFFKKAGIDDKGKENELPTRVAYC